MVLSTFSPDSSRSLQDAGLWIAVLLGLLGLLLGSPSPAAAQCLGNPIVCENQNTGTDEWQIDGPMSDDAAGQIQGYASATSVNVGDSIDFHITVENAENWSFELYRMGWYGGLGGRLISQASGLTGVDQPTCTVPAALGPYGSVECDWSISHTLAIDPSWTSGIYLAKLENASGYQSYIVFVVRDDARDAEFLYQQAVLNFQAYNHYPGSNGVSFYSGPGSTAPPVQSLSFDRPYGSNLFTRNNQSPFGAQGDGSASFFTWDYPMIRWLESEGYDVLYATNIDVHENPDRLLDFPAVVSVGHDEYWTDAMFVAMSNARDAGVNLGFFAGNHVFATVTLEPSTTGTPNRVVTGQTKGGQPGIDPNPPANPADSDWADHPDYVDKTKRQALLGQANTGCCVRRPFTYRNLPWIVDAAEHWVFAGTGFQNGDAVEGLLGYEPDAYDPAFPAPANLHFTRLSASPFTSIAAGDVPGGTAYLEPWPLDLAHSTIYQAPSGAWVFSAGSTDWAWGLDTPFAVRPTFEAAIGGGDPAEQGFGDDSTLSGFGTLVMDGGLPAWEADGSAGAAQWRRYPYGTEVQALTEGYVLSAELRVVSGGQIVAYFTTGSRRFLPVISLVGPNPNLVVTLEGGGTHVVASGAAATAFHTHRITYDAASDSATYAFDGVDQETWAGSNSAQTGLYFGQGSSGTPGVARFRSLSLVPSNPMTPDPRIQAMTRNVLERLATPFDPAAHIVYDAAIGSGHPLGQGWSDFTSLAGTGALVSDGGSPAWFADGTAGRANWTILPSPATKSLAVAQGWQIESVLRVASGEHVTDYYADGTRRFLPILQLVGAELRVQLEGGGLHVLATGTAASDYHTHSIRFDPTTQMATYFFDGVPIETWPGSATSQDFIAFGQGSTSLAGTAYYRSFRFEIRPIGVPGLTSIGTFLLALAATLLTARLVTQRSERAA